MHVAVAIVGFRNVGDITRCLTAIERSSHADFEVVICENGGPLAYEVLASALPSRLAGGQLVTAFLAPRNLGYAGGVNAIFRAAPNADAWWVLNPDTEAEPDAMRANVDRLAQGGCEAVGGTVYLPSGQVQSDGGRWRSWLARAVSIGNGRDLGAAIDPMTIEAHQSYINGASMFISRRFLEIAGPMREDYFLYGEEVEWCLRAKAKGAKLGFAEGARVLHQAGTTTGSYAAMKTRPRMPIYLDERNKMLVTRDCFPARLPVAAFAAFGLLVLRFGRHRAWRQLGYAMAGWFAGVLGRRGVPGWLPTS